MRRPPPGAAGVWEKGGGSAAPGRFPCGSCGAGGARRSWVSPVVTPAPASHPPAPTPACCFPRRSRSAFAGSSSAPAKLQRPARRSGAAPASRTLPAGFGKSGAPQLSSAECTPGPGGPGRRRWSRLGCSVAKSPAPGDSGGPCLGPRRRGGPARPAGLTWPPALGALSGVGAAERCRRPAVAASTRPTSQRRWPTPRGSGAKRPSRSAGTSPGPKRWRTDTPLPRAGEWLLRQARSLTTFGPPGPTSPSRGTWHCYERNSGLEMCSDLSICVSFKFYSQLFCRLLRGWVTYYEPSFL